MSGSRENELVLLEMVQANGDLVQRCDFYMHGRALNSFSSS